jgi:hypothetical protein
VVQATQPVSPAGDGSIGVRTSDWDVEEERVSSMGISLTPTENNVRRRFGSLTKRSDTLGGIVASTLVLYTFISWRKGGWEYQNERSVLLVQGIRRGCVFDIMQRDIVQK